MSDSVHARLADRADRAPGAPALLAPGRTPTDAAGLVALVTTVADRLRTAVAPGAAVALALPDGPDLAVTVLAGLGTVPVAPLAADRPVAEHVRDLRAMGAGLLVVQHDHDTPARAAAAELGLPVAVLTPGSAAGAFTLTEDARPAGPAPAGGPDLGGVALVLFTSGTTSRPKLVPLTEANLLASAGAVADTLRLAPGDRTLGVMPLFHIHGLVAALLAPLASGGSVVATPGFRPGTVWDWIDEFRPTWYTAVPTIHQAMVEVTAARTSGGRAVRSSLTFVRSSSAALPGPVRTGLEAVLGVPVVEAYGMTEAAHQIASTPRPDPRARSGAPRPAPGTVGRATGCELVVLDPAGQVLPAGSVGEVAIRGPGVTTGYLDAPEAQAESFRDGWFRTGDQGVLDADGVLTLTGRFKELVNRGGEKVAPAEVEEVLRAHPDVTEAVAFAVPHPRLGEEVGAAVVLRPDATVTGPGLRVFAAGRLAPYKVPRRVVVVDAVPRGATGKVERRTLAARLGLDAGPGPAPAAPPTPPADDLEARIAALWQTVLGDDVLPDVTGEFYALGGDSLHAVVLLEEVARAFGRHLPATMFVEGVTVRSMAAALRADPVDVSTPAVVPVQPGGDLPPLFGIMRAGSVVALRHLATALGPDRPVFGLWMPAMHGPPDAAGTIEDIAATAVGLVRGVRPHGPYLLFGHSLGAVVAYEVACQLAAADETVAFLGMADGVHPEWLRRRYAHRHSLRYRLRKLVSRKGPAVVAYRLRQVWTRVRRRPAPARPVLRLPGTDAVADWSAALARERAYHPGPAPVPVTLLVCRAYADLVGRPDLGWAGAVPDGSEWVAVPGDHDTMIGEPHVHVLAAEVAARVAALPEA
jgi:acyl-CoA synthetase (AMP-forming)/AMP-acid ligase II/thioesterase domain-containing protein